MGICHVSKKVEQVILAIAKEGEIQRKEIAYKYGIAGGTVSKIVNWLLERGLAEEVPVSRYKVVVRLTDKGRRLAELVKEIEELVGGDP